MTPSDLAEAIRKLVDERIERLFSQFINKQTEKVADIIAGRAGEVTGEVSPSIWEARLFFVLNDSTRFEMRMKIVSKVSCCGTPFYQFPTTFHDAYDAKGKSVWASEYNLKCTLGSGVDLTEGRKYAVVDVRSKCTKTMTYVGFWHGKHVFSGDTVYGCTEKVRVSTNALSSRVSRENKAVSNG